jgi:hypothetical protein
MLQELTNRQVEKALEWLASPELSGPPEELVALNQIEWYLLNRLLDDLMREKDSLPLH